MTERTNVSKALGYNAPIYQEFEAAIRRLPTDELQAQSLAILTDPRVTTWLQSLYRLAIINDELAHRALELEANAKPIPTEALQA